MHLACSPWPKIYALSCKRLTCMVTLLLASQLLASHARTEARAVVRVAVEVA